MSTHDRHEPRCGVLVLCEVSMIRIRMVRAMSSSFVMSVVRFMRAPGSGLVRVVEGLPLQLLAVGRRPFDASIEALLERYPVAPAQRFPELRAVEHVGRILAEALADDFHAVPEARSELDADALHQLADRDDLGRGDMVGLPRWSSS